MPSLRFTRFVPWIVGALGVALIAAFALIGVLFVRLEDTRGDLERVEGGALLSAIQLQAFRVQLVTLGPTVAVGLDDAIEGLGTFGESSLEFRVEIDEQVPIDTVLRLDREFTIPIDTTIPIQQTIETTIDVQGPLGIVVPVDVAVPIDLEVPVVLDVVFTVEEDIPVVSSVPVHLDLPIEIQIADTGLAELGESLGAGLEGFRDALTGLAQ